MKRHKAVIVMGGSIGIGSSISRHLAAAGHRVVALGPAPERSEPSSPPGLLMVETDLLRVDTFAARMREAHEALGTVDVLVNALDDYSPTPLAETTPAAWSATLDYNLKSVFFSSQAVVPYMSDAGGMIINLSSARAYVAARDQVAYSAAKCGVAAMTRELATDLGRYGIKCDSLMLFADGADATLSQQTPSDADVCEAVSFLISEGSYQALDAFDYPLDGGLTVLLDRIDGGSPAPPDDSGGRVAVITGGSGGLGAASARIFARKGIRIALLDVLDEEGRAVAEEIREYGDAEYYHCDVASNTEITTTVDAIAQRFGRIDILYNAAAITSRKRTPEITEDDWDRFMDIDLKGPFYMARACAAHMRKTGGGRIVNFSSMLSTLSHGRHTLYGGAKEALNSMTRAMGAALKPDNIQVFSVLPAYVITPMIEFRLSDPEWIARNYRQSLSKVLLYPEHVTDVFDFLTTSETSATSGHKIYVDTGYLNFRYKLVPWDEPAVAEGVASHA
ncbi:SDR family NAD(P)-dependent oxidoreductase [Propionicicella superfundia]|uniref:SDR family NAD(P)-dependent oxidoreductase n=1 Tax=Propionicicella superfundia TaxID=348582 RepID=UPI0003F7C85C|nr:SDR family NAD(P)-dependent oxidoreductase [Propionicicella superfundia]